MQNTSFLIEPSEAEALLGQEHVLIIDLGKAETYQQEHLAGAINLNYEHIIHGLLPVPGGLPKTPRLRSLFDALGLTPDTHVLVYDDEGNGKASRFIWTLDIIGHTHYSLINGGIHAWANEGHPVSTEAVRPQPASSSLTMNYAPLADKDYVHSVLDSDKHIILDVRSYEEYSGMRGGMRKGHIPGAIHFNWLDAVDRNNNLRFVKDDILLKKFDALGLDKNKEIITYCYTHHRSAHTYAVLKHLGFTKIKGYAGSWSEWNADQNLPIE
ncbi:MAG: sulfurtransferase [Arenicellales bacterium]